MRLKLLRSALATLRYAPHWLGEREVMRCEGRMLVFLAAQDARSLNGAPPDRARLMEEVRANHRQRSAQIAASGVRRLVCALYDRYAGLSPAARAPLRGVWRLVRAAIRDRDRPEPPLGAPVRLIAPAPAATFAPTFPRASAPGPVAAIIHLFYPDLAAELRDYLEAIPGRVDIFCSTDTPAKQDSVLAAFSGWDRGSVEVRIAPNRGRDIAPKLICFGDVYDRYELVLHLHSKRSPHDSNLRLWLYFVLETLIGRGGDVASSVLGAFAAEPDIGIIAAQHFFPVQNDISWGPNLDDARALALRMGFDIDPSTPIDFPSGSMFWARSAALKPLLDLDLAVQDFPPEMGQRDGTLAHAIERLYFLTCEKAGFRWLKIGRPELAHASDPPLARIENSEQLKALLGATHRLLPLAPSRPPKGD